VAGGLPQVRRRRARQSNALIHLCHAHCLVSRTLWNTDRLWIPLPYIDTNAGEKLSRHKILHFLKRKGLLSDERIELLNSFRNSGFSVDTSPTVWPQDSDGLERLGRYMLRCPLSLSRIHWTEGARPLFYQAKASHHDPQLSSFHHPDGETLDVFEFIARVLTQIPAAPGNRWNGNPGAAG